MGVEVTSNIIEKLQAQIKDMRHRTVAGVWKAALVVKAASIKKTPVATGFLRNSAYTTAFEEMSGPVAEIGYTASYAIYVHEINKHYRKPGTSWKFLQLALEENRERILRIIEAEAKIKR